MAKKKAEVKPKEKSPLILKPNPLNPNRMSDEDKQRLVKALTVFGDLSGIIFNRRTGLMVGGHQRIDVLQKSKMEVVDLPQPEADGTVARGWLINGKNRFALRVVDWPEKKANAAMVAANRFGRVGADDVDMLQEIIKEIDVGEFDLDVIGYTRSAVEMILGVKPTNPKEAWQGMPEYEHEDQMPYRSIIIHFNKEKDVEAFAALLNQTISEKTKWLWYPEQKRNVHNDKRYVYEDEKKS